MICFKKHTMPHVLVTVIINLQLANFNVLGISHLSDQIIEKSNHDFVSQHHLLGFLTSGRSTFGRVSS